jgi:hypothetical protein
VLYKNTGNNKLKDKGKMIVAIMLIKVYIKADELLVGGIIAYPDTTYLFVVYLIYA